MGRPKAVLSGENTIPVQSDLAGFTQKRVPKIETWAGKADATRDSISELKKTLANQEFKLREAMHENEDACDKQESPDGDKLIVYKRANYDCVAKRGKEKVNYKVKDAAKGDVPTDGDGDAGSND